MNWKGTTTTLESAQRRVSRRRVRNQLKTRSNPRLANLESLECRTLRSTIPLSGFPAGGFRSTVLEGAPPWEVSLLVDGQPALATGYEESTERFERAPAVILDATDSTWVAGIIGDTRLHGSGGATNDVDLYRIDLPGGDHYALSLHTLAQRFGSALDSALSLFDSAGNLLASNDDALHPEALSDSEIYAGVNGGTYYIAVSAGGNLPGEPGGFDPLIPGSGTSSHGSKGQYLLQISAVSDLTRPEVAAISIQPDAHLTEPLTQITVRFSEPMDLIGLLTGAELIGPGNQSIGLSATHFDPEAVEITYTLQSRPLPGDYEFTLRAAEVTDRAGNPIVGDDAQGGFVLHFSVDTPAPSLQDTEPNDTISTAQQLGPLYNTELRTGITITGSVNGSADQDLYRFQVIRSGFFTFRLRPGVGSTQTGSLLFRDADGQLLGQGFGFPGSGSTLIRFLRPGEYLVQMSASQQLTAGNYRLTIQSASEPDVPLVDQSYVPPVVTVTLRTHDGERTPDSDETGSSPESIVVVTGDTVAYSVGSVPAVGSQPVGHPQLAAAGPVELAWLDISSEQRPLPIGVVIRPRESSESHYAVTSVSGSFLEPLPDAVGGDGALMTPLQLGAELRTAMQTSWSIEAARPSSGSQSTTLGSSDRALAEIAQQNSSDDSPETVQVASTPSGIAFGMVASLGVVSAATSPNRRRSNTWVHQAFELLGLDLH